MSRDDVEEKLRLAEETLQQAAARLEGTEKRLESLEQERAAALGEAEIARRTLSDIDRVMADLREELAALELEEARHALTEAAHGRDKVIAEAAAALETAVRLLEEIEVHRAAVEEAHERVISLSPSGAPRGRAPAPEEPDILHEPWQRLVAVVRDRLDEELESEVVDAAARSHAPYAINALPEHLRAVAMERRRKLHQAGLDRLQETRERLQVVERDESRRA
jgi:chromosome segregation ATPase